MTLINRLIECMLEINHRDCADSIIQILNSVDSYEDILPMKNIILVLNDENVMTKFHEVHYRLTDGKSLRDIRTYFLSLSSCSSP